MYVHRRFHIRLHEITWVYVSLFYITLKVFLSRNDYFSYLLSKFKIELKHVNVTENYFPHPVIQRIIIEKFDANISYLNYKLCKGLERFSWREL